MTTEERGPKDTKNKLAWSSFPFEEAEEVAKIFSESGKPDGKYGAPFTYRKGIPINELWDALFRHMMEIRKGNMIDDESGLSHFAHIAANGLMGISQLKVSTSFIDPAIKMNKDELYKKMRWIITVIYDEIQYLPIARSYPIEIHNVIREHMKEALDNYCKISIIEMERREKDKDNKHE